MGHWGCNGKRLKEMTHEEFLAYRRNKSRANYERADRYKTRQRNYYCQIKERLDQALKEIERLKKLLNGKLS